MSHSERPPLLLIPGIAGSCAGLNTAATGMFPGLTHIPFDHGIGLSAKSIEEVAEQAVAFLPRDEPAYLCGESFGGPVALTLARRYPERVRGLILLSTFARHPSAGRLHARMLVALWAALIQRMPLLAYGARIAGMPGQFGRSVPLAAALTYLREPLTSGPEYRDKVRLIATFDARPWLSEVMCPSIVVLGRRDPIVPPGAGRELGRLLPNATVHELDCGHLGYLAMPDRIRTIVDRWRAALELPGLCTP